MLPVLLLFLCRALMETWGPWRPHAAGHARGRSPSEPGISRSSCHAGQMKEGGDGQEQLLVPTRNLAQESSTAPQVLVTSPAHSLPVSPGVNSGAPSRASPSRRFWGSPRPSPECSNPSSASLLQPLHRDSVPTLNGVHPRAGRQAPLPTQVSPVRRKVALPVLRLGVSRAPGRAWLQAEGLPFQVPPKAGPRSSTVAFLGVEVPLPPGPVEAAPAGAAQQGD